MGYVNTANMANSLNRGGKIFSGEANFVISNGHIVTIGDLKQGQTQIHSLAKPANVQDKAVYAVVNNPEITRESVYNRDRDRYETHVNPINTTHRAIVLEDLDILEISIDLITALANNVPVKGNYLVLKANDLGYEEKANVTNEAVVFKIEEIFEDSVFKSYTAGFNDTTKSVKMARVRVVKSGK